jgi:GNAT superfamily N-acetyltransferase
VTEGVKIEVERPVRPDVKALLLEARALLTGLYPPESCHGLDLSSYERPEVTLFVARSAGVAVGCGAYQLHDDGSAEVKSMFVVPGVRGRGIGRQVLEAIEAAVRGRVSALRLRPASSSWRRSACTRRQGSGAGGRSAAIPTTRSACSWRRHFSACSGAPDSPESSCTNGQAGGLARRTSRPHSQRRTRLL